METKRQDTEAARLSEAERKADLQLIGELIVQQGSLEKRIGRLCDELAKRAAVFAAVANLLITKPECVVFKGQAVAEEFAGESAVDPDAIAVDSLLADLRDAITKKTECAKRLSELGIDPAETENERNDRLSRALRHPAFDPKPRRTSGFGFYPKSG